MDEVMLVVRDALREPHRVEQLASDPDFWFCATCNAVVFRYFRARCPNEFFREVPWPG